MRRLTPILIALAVGLAISALRIIGWQPLDLLEMRAIDYRLRQRGAMAATSEVVIVGVDEASLKEVGRWPWSRARIAALLERITAGGAAVVGVDIVQSEPTAACQVEGLDAAISRTCATELSQALRGPLNEDVRLAEAVRASGRIVLGYYFDFANDRETPYEGEAVYPQVLRGPGGGDRYLPIGRDAVKNLPDITAAAASLGYFNFLPDVDGIFRRAPLAIRFQDKIVLPLSLAMLQRARTDATPAIRIGEAGVDWIRVGAASLPVDANGQLLINFRGPGHTVTHISAADVLAGRMAPDALRDKLVLLGVTAVGVGDVRATAFDPVYPGVEIHASLLDNILRQDFLHRPAWFGPDVATIVGLALLLAVGLQFTRGVAGALLAVVVAAAYLAGSQWLFTHGGSVLGAVYQILAVGFTYVAVSVQHYVTVDREKRRTRRMLDLYLSPALATYVSERPETLQLGGEKSDRTVLFSDVKGFTTISERLTPEQLVELLNIYLGDMTDAVFAHDGMLDKYIGDGVMAVWGAPVPQDDHAARACRAALEMMERLERLNATIVARGWPELHVRVGLNSGPMVFGNMGSRGHLSLTVMGDNVNLGARLEGVNKQYGTAILASEATVVAAGDTIVTRELDVVRVKGKDETVRIYEVLGPGDSAPHWAVIREHFAAGIAAYRARRFAEAVASFERVLDERANDHPSALYIRRARALIATPPPDDWEAVVNFDEK